MSLIKVTFCFLYNHSFNLNIFIIESECETEVLKSIKEEYLNEYKVDFQILKG
jgi:hypothetical protein